MGDVISISTAKYYNVVGKIKLLYYYVINETIREMYKTLLEHCIVIILVYKLGLYLCMQFGIQQGLGV